MMATAAITTITAMEATTIPTQWTMVIVATTTKSVQAAIVQTTHAAPRAESAAIKIPTA